MRKDELLVFLLLFCFLCLPTQAVAALVKIDLGSGIVAEDTSNALLRNSDMGADFNNKTEAKFFAGRIITMANFFEFFPNFFSMNESFIISSRVNQFEDNFEQENIDIRVFADALPHPAPKPIILILCTAGLVAIIVRCIIKLHVLNRQLHQDQKLTPLMIAVFIFWRRKQGGR